MSAKQEIQKNLSWKYRDIFTLYTRLKSRPFDPITMEDWLKRVANCKAREILADEEPEEAAATHIDALLGLKKRGQPERDYVQIMLRNTCVALGDSPAGVVFTSNLL